MESIDVMNRRLKDHYGTADDGNQKWRLVLGTEQMERVKGTFTKYDDHGNYLGEYEAIELRPKYPYAQNKYVLEMYLRLPSESTDIQASFSYEPTWVFQDMFGNPLPPIYDYCQLVIATIYAKAAQSVGAKYKETNEEHTIEQLKEQIRIREELFGNDTSITDSLHQGSAVSLTGKKLGEIKCQ